MMASLGSLRDKLATVAGVSTCKIGMEANMSPSDYPMVRIVPSTIRYGEVLGQRECEVTVYFGLPIHEFTAGLEAMYADMFAMEAALIGAAQSTPDVYVQYLETVLDEDRLEAYKLMALRLNVTGMG